MNSSASPLVTLALPTYNRVAGLEKVLRYTMEQQYKNCEILVADNCSADIRAMKELLSNCQKDDRVKYFRHSKNIGPIANYEFLLRKARGKYILFLPDDDRFQDMEYITKAVQSMESNQGASAVFGRVNYLNKEEKIFCSDEGPLFLGGTLFERMRNYIIYDVTDHLIYCLLNTAFVKDFVFPKDVVVPEKFLILQLLLRGPIIENSDVYYFNNYSFKTMEEVKKFFKKNNFNERKYHLKRLKYYFNNLAFPQALYLAMLYTFIWVPKVSWIVRKLTAYPKTMPGRVIKH